MKPPTPIGNSFPGRSKVRTGRRSSAMARSMRLDRSVTVSSASCRQWRASLEEESGGRIPDRRERRHQHIASHRRRVTNPADRRQARRRCRGARQGLGQGGLEIPRRVCGAQLADHDHRRRIAAAHCLDPGIGDLARSCDRQAVLAREIQCRWQRRRRADTGYFRQPVAGQRSHVESGRR